MNPSLFDLTGRDRFGQKIALATAAAKIFQDIELFGRFDTLGDCVQSKLSCEANDGAHGGV